MEWLDCIFPTENSQGKWNETTDSDNSEGWKLDGC
jgi:hypothetical protein